jgi:hypothetical protein
MNTDVLKEDLLPLFFFVNGYKGVTSVLKKALLYIYYVILLTS